MPSPLAKRCNRRSDGPRPMLSWCSIGGRTEAMCGWGSTPAALVASLAASAACLCLRGNRVTTALPKRRSALGHFDQFPSTHPSVGYLFGHETFAGSTATGEERRKRRFRQRELKGQAGASRPYGAAFAVGKDDVERHRRYAELMQRRPAGSVKFCSRRVLPISLRG